jgi:hypothetical protein
VGSESLPSCGVRGRVGDKIPRPMLNGEAAELYRIFEGQRGEGLSRRSVMEGDEQIFGPPTTNWLVVEIIR